MIEITHEEIINKLYSSKTRSQITHKEVRKKANTGITKIDERFGFPTGFYVIAGSPGAGKGWFALWLSKNFMIHNNKKSVYFSLEMSESLVRNRILQQWSGLTQKQFEEGGDIQWAIEKLEDDNIIVDEYYSDNDKFQTPQSFIDWFKKYYKLGYRVFHFDHLHELSGANDNNSNQAIMEKWAKMFQTLTKKYSDVWLFIYVQPNGKAYEKGLLKRQDISGSKVIIQKCEFFISLNREQVDGLTEESKDIYIYIDKNRYSECNHVAFKLRFAETGNFHSIIGTTNE